MSYITIDLNRFLSDDIIQPDLLQALDRETPIIMTNDFNDFLNLPLNEAYTKNKALNDNMTITATETKEIIFSEPDVKKLDDNKN
jgi:hypothetical protein